MAKQKIYPTCRICDKLNAEMTHCAIFGALAPCLVDNTAVGATCNKSGDYVLLIRAAPNEYNNGKTPSDKPVDEEKDNQHLVFDAEDETQSFLSFNFNTLGILPRDSSADTKVSAIRA